MYQELHEELFVLTFSLKREKLPLARKDDFNCRKNKKSSEKSVDLIFKPGDLI